jgi:cytochrome o ubiquinol oxidase subunit 3
MTTATTHTEHHPSDKVYFGFWLYLMTDLIVFSVLFATFVVLRDNTFGGPSGRELFDLPMVLIETMLLLISSFTCGMAVLAARRGRKLQSLAWLVATTALGFGFLGLELSEFGHLIAEGHTWQSSAFLSAFFTLVGTHGIHISAGLLWLLVLIGYIATRGVTASAMRKLILLSLFWHFLDVVWIFIFTIVYLMGVI